MPRLSALWERLRDSLWFLPTILVLSAILLGVAMIELSSAMDEETLARWPRIFGAGPDGARSMLAAIAGSMITVAGVTFSITMVAVTQASSQYTPRILRNFMRDRANQAVLGTFVGIYAYCLVVLRTIRSGDELEFVPSLAVLVGVLLALVGVAVLIFFVHHIAATLQATDIIARITEDTGKVIDRLHLASALDPGGPPESGGIGERGAERASPIPAPATGYIQRADVESLVRVAERHEVCVHLSRQTGEFVIEGRPLGYFVPDAGAGRPSATSAAELVDTLGGCVLVGKFRSLDHDPGFGMRQLVDIALKALSPGINDSTTAVTCVDYLGALLVRLAGRTPVREHRGPDQRLRVVTAEPGFEDLVGLAMDEIRQHAQRNLAVLGRQLAVLGELAAVTPPGPRRLAVLRHRQLVERAAAAAATEPYDREKLDLPAVTSDWSPIRSAPE